MWFSYLANASSGSSFSIFVSRAFQGSQSSYVVYRVEYHSRLVRIVSSGVVLYSRGGIVYQRLASYVGVAVPGLIRFFWVRSILVFRRFGGFCGGFYYYPYVVGHAIVVFW